MFPLYDESRTPGKTPLATISLILLNVTFFFISLPSLEGYIEIFGFIPTLFFQRKALFSLFSSMFLHEGFFHLLGNMWYLWIFGDNVEGKLGKIKYFIFYLLSGIGGSLLYSLTAVDKTTPVIGASGAISGILAGYLILFPRHNIRTLVPFFWFWRIVSIPALIFIIIWFLYQFIYLGSDPFVAYWGHIGGFLTGLLLIRLFKHKRT
jgi:membrane associated rhomboid family serine protease